MPEKTIPDRAEPEAPGAGRRVAAARRFSRTAGMACAVIGTIVLLGWVLDRESLKTLLVQPPIAVKTNTALCFLCAGIALRLLASTPGASARRTATAAAIFVLVVGGLTLSQHLAGWNLGIDELLFHESPGALGTASPNRMGPPGSLSFLLLGLSLLLLSRTSESARRAREVMALAVIVIALLGLLGYATGAGTFYAVARVTGIALTTSAGLLVLASGVLAASADHRIVTLVCREDEAGALVRQLAVPALLLPLFAATALAWGMNAGLYDGAFAVATLALFLVVCLAAVIARSGARLAHALEERDAAESARRRREDELRAANQRQTEFLAVLSHELRNPLAPMRYALQMLDEPAADGSKPKDVIGRQLTHMVRLVDDLLDVTRITSGKIQLRPRRVDLQHVVEQALEATGPDLRARQHRVEVSMPSGPIWLEADPDRLSQVMTNLLVNAGRYTTSPGRIVVDVSTSEGEAVISLRDTGIGLRQEDLDRVFEMFTQVSGPGSGGLGIGLALARQIVAHHGGRIEARSEGLGKGSEIVVRLPLAPAPPPTSASTPVDRVRAAARRVLVVDDNADSADMLATILQLEGHEVHVAYDGTSALSEIERAVPEVGIFDIGLPDMDGYELARLVRASARTTYLIAVTGWGQESDRRRARDAGFDAHLTKPPNPAELRRLVAAATASDRGIPSPA
jgi:signal transduction histidine kinase/ActR/RegA family two-component response regulator